MVCPKCGYEAGSANFCQHCGHELISQKCIKCGSIYQGTVCPNCGYHNTGLEGRQSIDKNNESYVNENFNFGLSAERLVTSSKSKKTTLLLSIFLGAFGIHRFYVGRYGTGLLWLFTAGIFYVGWFADIYLIASGKFSDANGLPLK